MGDEGPGVVPRRRLDPATAAVRGAVRSGVEDLAKGALVLVALSGGPDSLALLATATFVGTRAGLRVGAVVVDHSLQEGSAVLAASVADQARGLGAEPVAVVAVRVGSTGGPEAAARRARYAALRDQAARTGAACVLLGHTRDDQAETVLLGLARGSGTRALSGMAAENGVFRRPLLAVPRSQTVDACRAAGLTWWDDPHNRDPAYARSRVRSRVLPVLEAELGPGTAAALARTATLARADADLLDSLAADVERVAAGGDDAWDAAAIAAAPPALQTRVLRRAALTAGCPAGDLNAGHVDALSRLLAAAEGTTDLPGGIRAHRSGNSLWFGRLAVTG